MLVANLCLLHIDVSLIWGEVQSEICATAIEGYRKG